jgi:hypothetical protein
VLGSSGEQDAFAAEVVLGAAEHSPLNILIF